MSGTAGGRLVLVATPIGNLADLSPRAAAELSAADVIACEDTRRSGRLLAHAGVSARRLVSLHEHNEAERSAELAGRLSEGEVVAVVTDAGTPAVSDPGARLVRAALSAGAEVTAVPGPSAVLAALVVSGLDIDRWRFEGFLPRKGPERRDRLAAMAASPVPTVCFESPHRLGATLGELAEACGPTRQVVVARELTKLHEEVWRGELGEAVASTSAASPRGEQVVVVDRAPPAPPKQADDGLPALVGRLVEAGLSKRDAAIAASVALGVPRRAAYAAANAAGDAFGGRDPAGTGRDG